MDSDSAAHQNGSKEDKSAIPPYILEHAPIVYLHPEEPFWPASPLTHIQYCAPSRTCSDGVTLNGLPVHLKGTFASLAWPDVNSTSTYLTASHDVRKDRTHAWLVSQEGKPDGYGRSTSECVLIIVEKDHVAPHTVDAFWFFFHSFNLGPKVVGYNLGNHVADWEHCMIRFTRGIPMAMHLSSHADGFAYSWDCMETSGNRPIIYCAIGSHALYPLAGSHSYSFVRQAGPVDRTAQGPRWDPLKNFRAFRHVPTPERDVFAPFDEEKDGEFVHCLRFQGKWGDKFSVEASTSAGTGGFGSRAFGFLTRAIQEAHWGDGSTGPRDKTLDRTGMNRTNNIVRHTLRDCC